MPNYAHILSAVARTPWAILPAKFAEIQAFLVRASAGRDLSDAEVAAVIQAQAGGGRTSVRVGSTAVVAVHGVLTRYVSAMAKSSGAMTLDDIEADFNRAVADPQVQTVVLDVDSPGGSVYGIPEFAAKVAAAREKKRIVAVVNNLAASAAYWVAAAAHEVVITPSGQAGSIGVFLAHEDVSQALEQAGVKMTFIKAGRFKTEGNPYEALSEDGRAHMQEMVDGYHAMFIKAVADGRGVSQTKVREDFGQGRLMMAGAAVKAGLADSVGTLEGVLGRLLLKDGKRAGAARAITTVRDFEAFLRDEGGLSHTEAKRLASLGFAGAPPARDGSEAVPSRTETSRTTEAEDIQLLKAYVEAITPQERK